MKSAWRSLAAVCVLVIVMYAYTAPLSKLESLSSNPADTYYNLLVQGFRDGHLSLKKEVPTGFAHLADPSYDPAANRSYRNLRYELMDLSYYKGRLYLYFGITPALILFWPFVALTGHYLFDRLAVTIFCAVGVTVSLGLLRALWQRYFTEVSVWVVAACALALGLATGVPVLLPPSGIYQVAISCGYMLTMLALGAVWCALHDTEQRCRWLMTASVAYGLAVGARPSLLFGAGILLVPVAQAWRERRKIWAPLMAATGPIMLIGLGLMLYNALRFDNPFEFGWRYQLSGDSPMAAQQFSLRYLWFNFRVYFLEPARWSARFPFVHKAAVPPLPSGYVGVQEPFGVLANIPLAWLALAVPLAWRERADQERGALRWFVTAVCLLVGMCALTLGFYCYAAGRFEVDFLPALVLLAVVGILGLERAVAAPGAGMARQPVRWRLVRWGWSLLLGFSVVFNVLVSGENYAYAGCSLGTTLAAAGRVPEAIRVLENFLQIVPDYAEGHLNLGIALGQAGKGQEAIEHFEQALRINPDYAEAHITLGNALTLSGRVPEAIEHFEQALRINPDDAEAHYSLGNALAQMGRVPEAIVHYEQALRINPDDAEAHYNLGNALEKLGRTPEAIAHYEQVLRIKPDSAEAHSNLGAALAQTGRIEEAIAHYQQALRINPDLAEVHYNLGQALAKVGRVPEAVLHYEQALRIRPDLTQAQNALARLQAGR
ncbi:MAG: tetratricopeptide repeat protein [Verrucomicrobiia bacterium]